MPRPIVSTPIKQNLYITTPGREQTQRGPKTPGPEEHHTPRQFPPVEEDLRVVTPKECNKTPSRVVALGSDEAFCNGEVIEGDEFKSDTDVVASRVSDATLTNNNADSGKHCLDMNGVVGYIEASLASVQDEMNLHHDAMADSFYRHRQIITSVVSASLSGQPVDLPASALDCRTAANGMNLESQVIPQFRVGSPKHNVILPRAPGERGFKPSTSFVTEMTPGGSIITRHREVDANAITVKPMASTISSMTPSNGRKRNNSSKASSSVLIQESATATSDKALGELSEHVRKSLDNLKMLSPKETDGDLKTREEGSWHAPSRKGGKSKRLDLVFSGKSESGTPVLDLLIGILILLNALILCLFSQWEGYKAAIKLGWQQPDDGWAHAETVFTVFEHFFCATFFAEFCIRIKWQGWAYWKDPWNDFDAFLVFTSLVDLYLLQPFSSGSGANLTLLRLARIFKLVKVLRVVRVLKMFSSLRILTKTMAASFTSLIWSMVLLGIIMCLGGMFLVQMLNEPINDEDVKSDLRAWAFRYYGTSVRGIYTMFEVTMSGCWPNYARRLIDEINPYYGVFWVLYVSFVVFAVIRIITAIFLKHTLDNAGSDADLMIAAQMKKKRAYVEKLAEAFEAIDESGDGTITRKEFHEIVCHPKVRAYLAVLDLEIHETNSLFDLLEENNDGIITYQEFLDGVMRLKGQARTLDIVEIQRNIKRLLSCVYAVCDAFEEIHHVSLPCRTSLHEGISTTKDELSSDAGDIQLPSHVQAVC